MTVRKLNEIEKSVIADAYLIHKDRISQLARRFNVSRRTIDRVLIERGVKTIRPAIKQVPQPIPTKQPSFFEKCLLAIKSAFRISH